ncbi:RT0821/Lpp0805 family surface protein [Alphaproteobacteria bacterium]|nr:RT0821/Lpp0805 family surface protein [Alphaproteobacteria bacterium]
MLIRRILLMIIICIFITSCQITKPKEQMGKTIGALGGVILGSNIGSGKGRIISTVIGGKFGYLIGKEIGRKLDEKDKILLSQATLEALEDDGSNPNKNWGNIESGNYGEISTEKTYLNNEGKSCRKFNQKVTISKKTQVNHGIACKQSDGTWVIKKS